MPRALVERVRVQDDRENPSAVGWPDHQHRSVNSRTRIADHDAIAIADLPDLFSADVVSSELLDGPLRDQQDGDQHHATVAPAAQRREDVRRPCASMVRAPPVDFASKRATMPRPRTSPTTPSAVRARVCVVMGEPCRTPAGSATALACGAESGKCRLDLTGVNLATWLPAVTLPGAAALTGQPWGTRYDFEVLPLPLTAPRLDLLSDSPQHRQTTSPPFFLSLSFHPRTENGGPSRPLHSEAVRMLPVLLAPGQRRRDGLPRWNDPCDPVVRRAHTRGATWATGWARKPTDEVVREPRHTVHEHYNEEGRVVGETRMRMGSTRMTKRLRHDRSVARDILAAVALDLKECPILQVNRRLLQLGGDLEYTKDGHADKSPRGAERACARGRALLALLGAWPWTHAVQGRLPSNGEWRAGDQYVQPLVDWIRAEAAPQQQRLDLVRRGLDDPQFTART